MKFSIGAVLPGIALAAASLGAHAQVTESTAVTAKARMEVAEKANPFARLGNVTTADPISAEDSLGTLESIGTEDSLGTLESIGAEDSLGTLESIGAEDSLGTLESIGAEDSLGTLESIGAEDSLGTLESIGAEDSLGTLESIGAEDSLGTLESIGAEDSLGTLESLDTTDSFETNDTLMTLPYRAEQKEYGTWVIMRDYTPGDGAFDYELFETMCIKAKGTKFVGQPTDINSNNFVWGAIKNKQGKIKINYATDEASGVDEVVHIEVIYNEADPYNWVGSWTSKTQAGDARVEFLHTPYWYQERGCYDAFGL